MKNFLFLFVLLSGGKSCDQPVALPLIKATSQAWSGGAAGSGHGTYYTVYLDVSNPADYKFDSLWVNNKRIPVIIKQHTSANDTLVLSANDMVHGIVGAADLDRQNDTLGVPLPDNIKAEGVLGYFYKNQHSYMLIQSWTKLKPLFYP